jgi:hypothetical protein
VTRAQGTGLARVEKTQPVPVPLHTLPETCAFFKTRDDPYPHQPHDEEIPNHVQTHFFSPARYYCVETIVAPCGVVIAWTKFDKSESPTKILDFLGTIYPDVDSRPSYVCIDKACLVLRTSIANGSWEEWKKTTRFIVDSYHYTNHKANDVLCSKYCNPSPTDGSAPNLVTLARDRNGVLQMQRAFNTQVSILFNI